jgi:hypothetical protein
MKFILDEIRSKQDEYYTIQARRDKLLKKRGELGD